VIFRLRDQAHMGAPEFHLRNRFVRFDESWATVGLGLCWYHPVPDSTRRLSVCAVGGSRNNLHEEMIVGAVHICGWCGLMLLG
jgi:hypothetical protein